MTDKYMMKILENLTKVENSKTFTESSTSASINTSEKSQMFEILSRFNSTVNESIGSEQQQVGQVGGDEPATKSKKSKHPFISRLVGEEKLGDKKTPEDLVVKLKQSYKDYLKQAGSEKDNQATKDLHKKDARSAKTANMLADDKDKDTQEIKIRDPQVRRALDKARTEYSYAETDLEAFVKMQQDQQKDDQANFRKIYRIDANQDEEIDELEGLTYDQEDEIQNIEQVNRRQSAEIERLKKENEQLESMEQLYKEKISNLEKHIDDIEERIKNIHGSLDKQGK